MKIELYYETIYDCIISCKHLEQLRVCSQMIEYFIGQRFAHNDQMPTYRKSLYLALERRQKEISASLATLKKDGLMMVSEQY